MVVASGAVASQSSNIGFSVGGAPKDINSFRLNIENHCQPQIESISFIGIFNDYYFDTNPLPVEENDMFEGMSMSQNDEKEDLPIFYPSYSCTKCIVPQCVATTNNYKQQSFFDMIQTNDTLDTVQCNEEYYLTVGLNSNIKESDFKRKRLNLCVVLDISGSMGSSFSNNSYGSSRTKMRVANECLLLLLTHLTPNDRFGLVLFDTSAENRIDMQLMSQIKMEQIDQILDIKERGGTNFEVGYRAGIKMYDNILEEKEYENRLVFLTDAHPNEGATDSNSLLNLVSNAANRHKNKVYTTFVGVGLDFNANLVSKIINVRGANQFSVHTNKEFKKRLSDEFDYFVSPMVFNLSLSLFCEGAKGGAIDKVYGSDNIDIENGEIMKIKTLFPSPPNDDGDIKGGIILIKLKQQNIQKNLPYFCEVSFEDKWGKIVTNKQQIYLNQSHKSEYFANLGVRKGILLVRYVKLIQDWIQNENQEKYKKMFKAFKEYFEKEMKFIRDKSLKQEVKILNSLINW